MRINIESEYSEIIDRLQDAIADLRAVLGEVAEYLDERADAETLAGAVRDVLAATE